MLKLKAKCRVLLLTTSMTFAHKIVNDGKSLRPRLQDYWAQPSVHQCSVARVLGVHLLCVGTLPQAAGEVAAASLVSARRAVATVTGAVDDTPLGQMLPGVQAALAAVAAVVAVHQALALEALAAVALLRLQEVRV